MITETESRVLPCSTAAKNASVDSKFSPPRTRPKSQSAANDDLRATNFRM